MSKEVLDVEIWKSSEDKRHIRFTSKEKSMCIFCYNPDFFDKEVIIKLLNNAGFVVKYYED